MSYYVDRAIKFELDNPREADFQYVDFSVVNNNPSGLPVPLIFDDVRSTPIIQDCSEYYATVVRFHITTIGMPVFMPQIQIGQSDVNLTEYSFTLSYNGFNAQVFMSFVPEYVNEQLPKPPILVQDVSTKYYYVSNYSYVVNLLNTTLKNAYTALALLTTLPSSTAAFILYDPISSNMLFNADVLNYDVTLPTPIKIYCNNQMFNLLSGFEWKIYGNNSTVGMNYSLNIYNNYGTNVLEIAGSSEQLIQVYEEYPSVNTWCCVQSVVLVCNNMPMNQTIVSPPKQYNSITSMNQSIGNSTLSILTDFIVAIDVNNRILPSIDYVSPAQYRLVDLMGSSRNLQNIQISVYWRDIYSNLRPIELISGADANLKLGLIRKSFYRPNKY